MVGLNKGRPHYMQDGLALPIKKSMNLCQEQTDIETPPLTMQEDSLTRIARKLKLALVSLAEKRMTLNIELALTLPYQCQEEILLFLPGDRVCVEVCFCVCLALFFCIEITVTYNKMKLMCGESLTYYIPRHLPD